MVNGRMVVLMEKDNTMLIIVLFMKAIGRRVVFILKRINGFIIQPRSNSLVFISRNHLKKQ